MAVAGALAVANFGMSLMSSRNAGRAARRAQRLRNKQISLDNERKVRAFARNAQQQRAASLAEAASGGQLTSSTGQGALSSVSTNTQNELDFFYNLNSIGGSIAEFEGAATSAQNQANMFSTVGNIFTSMSNTFE